MGKMILVAGGAEDSNILALLKQAERLHIAVCPLLTKADTSPAFTWDLASNQLSVNSEMRTFTGAFLRRNVFHSGGEEAIQRSAAWYETINGWLSMQLSTKMLNRRYLERYTNKLTVLYMAKKMGLTVPPTLATNVLQSVQNFGEDASAIVKPLNGGGFCQDAEELLQTIDCNGGLAANPAIVQRKITGDDIRIYRVQHSFIGFRIKSKVLDYRKTNDLQIETMPDLPLETVNQLKNLMDNMCLDWGAADFKECSETGEYFFLEVNSNPMFAAFDKIGEGAITTSMLDFLAT